jgi:hypothetical protein
MDALIILIVLIALSQAASVGESIALMVSTVQNGNADNAGMVFTNCWDGWLPTASAYSIPV